ncbi:MAG: alpha/beta fold hydrolase, partial [Anaerolineales bacterium]
APELLAERGFSADKVETARRFLNGLIKPKEMLPSLMKLSDAYNYRQSFFKMIRDLFSGPLPKLRPEALIYCAQNLLRGWSVMDRLSEIRVPTLVIAGRHDFQFPPEHQAELASGIPGTQLVLVEEAGHNPHIERTAEVVRALRGFLPST